MNVYLTKYDGYYVTVEGDKVCAYEGLGLCPKKVKTWLKTNKPVELPYFHREAIAYGHCK